MYRLLNDISENLSRRSFVTRGAATGMAAFAGLSTLGGCTQAPMLTSSAEVSGGFPTVVSMSEDRTLKPYVKPSVIPDEERQRSTKKVLIVVDYQVDFVDGGVFGHVEPACAIEDGICEVVERYRKNEDIILYTMDTHPSDHYEETREGTFNPPHCIPGTDGWQLYGKVRDVLNPENAIQVKKGTYGSRNLPILLEAIASQGILIESVEFAGVSTTCRVLHNAIIVYNFFPELPLIFDERTTASYTEESTQEQLAVLESWGFIVKRSS